MTLPIRFLDGRTFPTLTAAAKAYGLTPAGLLRRLENGQEPFTDIPANYRRQCSPCYYRGKQYPSRSAAAQAWGVSARVVGAAIKRQKNMG